MIARFVYFLGDTLCPLPQRVYVKWYNKKIQVVPRFLSTDRRDSNPKPKVSI
jgi:hypothetical protein